MEDEAHPHSFIRREDRPDVEERALRAEERERCRFEHRPEGEEEERRRREQERLEEGERRRHELERHGAEGWKSDPAATAKTEHPHKEQTPGRKR